MVILDSLVEEITVSLTSEIYSNNKNYVTEALDHPVYGSSLRCYVAFELFPEMLARKFSINQNQLIFNRFYWFFKYAKLYLSTTNGQDVAGVNDQFLKLFETHPIEDFDELVKVEDVVDDKLKSQNIAPLRFMIT